MRALLALSVLAVLSVTGAAYAETQTVPTEDGTLDVRITYDEMVPDEESKIKVDFLNPVTKNIQEHIDYTITITKEGDQVFGPTSLIHTSPGTITIPILFQSEGIYTMSFTVEGILFQIIPTEIVSFDIPVGDAALEPVPPPPPEAVDAVVPVWIKSNAGWWAGGQLDDATFVQGLEYLIQNGILVVPVAPADGDAPGGGSALPTIPPWVKTTAGWWAEDQIDDTTFVAALQFLIIQGIVQVP